MNGSRGKAVRPPSNRGAPTRRFAEFFAGIGLVRMGLEAEGWTLAYANDIDESKRQMYEAHFGAGAGHLHMGDIHRIDASTIPDVDLATASFPCTDLSLAGGRKGLGGAQSSAFWGFVSVLEGMGRRRPKAIMLENVVGFLNSHGGADFVEAMRALNGLGYAVDPFIMDARWFVPQSRPRLFVVGTLGAAGGDEPRIEPTRVRPAAIGRMIALHPEIRWRLHDLPDPPAASVRDLGDIVERLDDRAQEWWSAERTDYLYRQFSERHRTLADGMIAKRRWSYATVFRRVRLQPDGVKRSMGELRTDGVAGCLRTPKGGSGRQILVKAGYGRFAVRLLTPTECARLMGADGFRITVPDNQAYFGFGDAVCVPVISWVARHVLHRACASEPALSGSA